MKFFDADILKAFKTMLLVLCTVFALCSCSVGDKSKVTVIDEGLTGEESDLDEEQRSCWQAELLSTFYDAMSASSLKAYPKVSKSAMPFMMVAFAIWLSLRLLKHVSSVVEEKPAEVWTEIFKMAFVCLVCGLLASSTTFLLFVLNKLIFPFYYAFLEYGSLVLNSLTGGGNIDAEGIFLGDPSGEVKDGFCIVYTNSLVCKAPPLETVKIQSDLGSFPSGPSDLMQCLTCATSDRMHIGFKLSTFLMTMGSLSSALCGLILFAVFAIVKVAFVFYMIDSIFRMNIMVILLPCFILAFPFKFSRKWVKVGFESILNSAAILAFIGVLIAMALLAMQYILVDNADLFGTREHYYEFGVMPLSLILIAFLILKTCGIAVSLANALVGGGGNTKFQERIAKFAAWTAKKVFSAVTGGLGKIVADNPTVQRLREARIKAQDKINKMAGRS
ncbi:MAG: hypothetical protein IJ870_01615 [Alphaproteobacteria bacterium]|nr:hypothetical protein [Alphaproteobacteria bacterium]